MTTEISRRIFLQSAAASVTLPFFVSGVHAADRTVIDVMTDGDTNVTDWWTNTLAPMFEKANPDLSLNVVITRANGSNDVVGQRVVAAMQAKTDPKVDYFEEFDPRRVPGAAESGAFEPVDTKKIPNLALVNPGSIEIPQDIPYRASQVLLAYNSAVVSPQDVPKTWADLIAWIKGHPGQFIYCRPDKGGSGAYMVTRAIHEVNNRDFSLFKTDNFDADVAKKRFAGAWDILKDIEPYLYDKGSYPAGNNPTLQLFAGGAVSMITAWSDQSLQGISQGALPETTKLAQLQDLPFCGGYAFSSIPSQAAHKDAAFKLANFILTPPVQEQMLKDFGAFPSIEWSNLSPELAAKYTDVVSTKMPSFPGGQWSAALNDGWYSNVATHTVRG